jgi:D-amino-acid oxidase
VVVVGAGIIGLTAALTLQGSGRDVAIVTADAVEHTTSQVAAAVWFPTRVGPPGRVLGWGARTFEVLTSIAHEHPDAGVLLRRTRTLYRQPPGRPWWVDAIDDVVASDPADLPGGYSHGLDFTVPLAEMPVHLAWMRDRFTAGGGRIQRRRLGGLDELIGAAPVVVDCAGLGARTLVDDRSVTPIRGQLVRTTRPAGLTVSLRDEHHPDGYTYVHPRRDDCILGGTTEDGIWDTTPDPVAADAILRRCTELAPELADARVLEHRVGLRPGRPSVRLELERHPPADTTIVHDYGHGGAGVTLAWGCAEEVVALVDAAERR